MPVSVRVPSALQKFTGEQDVVKVSGETVREMIEDLEKNFPGIKERLCDGQGNLRRFINIYVNEEDVRFLEQDATPLKDGDEVSIIPAIAGGVIATRIVKLIFPQDLIKEPVTFRMAKQFDVIPNIRRAKVTETVGELVVELEGEQGNIEKGIAYLTNLGVSVEPVLGDIIE